ncbi:MAG: hypothetical protein EZS28_045121 [Streblomastix strix]|uniref:Uncharacterized protein n=1 Tax=Streblomastix strix TaxID=222440 RepID=A0A5J4TN91_9EUKA|nr:MAG: hypothetical protein EZS28_045121 [Streblomastix strix]
MAVGIFSKIKQLVQKVGKGLQWANDNIYKPFIKPFAKPILGALGPVGQTIGKDEQILNESHTFTNAQGNAKPTPFQPSPPILCTVHDTFWLFSPAAGGSCIYDTNHSFDEVNGPLSA